MPGNPNAKWPSQKTPYVKHCVDGKFLDKNGYIVLENQAEAHISLPEYNFSKLTKLLPYD